MTRAYLDLGDPAKALAEVDEALGLAPKNLRVLVDRGVALDSLQRHPEAQQCDRAVLAIEPRNLSARNDLALSLALSGQFDEAIALIEPMVRSSAATPQVRGNIAVILGLKGDSERAAMVSRVDLDEKATQANLAFLAQVRGYGAVTVVPSLECQLEQAHPIA
jgi:Flp pilus assembly protein TadD